MERYKCFLYPIQIYENDVARSIRFFFFFFFFFLQNDVVLNKRVNVIFVDFVFLLYGCIYG
jgi:hypothetical protein